MANTTYRIDVLAAGSSTVTVADIDGGTDTLEIQGSYAFATDIRLNYSNNLISTDATGLFYTPGVTHRLVVTGLIENVIGCDSADYIIGNEANNLLYGDHNGNGLGGNDTLSGGEGKDSLYGGNANDDLTGGNGDDRLFGDDGADTLAGGAGRDTIEGGVGADSLSGGAEAGDTVSYARSSAAVRIDIDQGVVTTGIGGDAQGDQLGGFLNVIGSNRNDVITDLRKGTIAFGYNDNAFSGGRGADTLVLGGGNDTASGGIGNDSLSGEVGRDRLIGGAGADLLSGGTSADRFIFQSAADSTVAPSGRDTISDFRHPQGDRIDIAQLDANINSTVVNDAFTFRTALQGFSGSGAEVTYVAVIGGVRVLADNDADGRADFAILLQGVSVLVAGDFYL